MSIQTVKIPVVVAGLIIKDGRVLLTQDNRASTRNRYCWGTPGGKVEEQETDTEALERELFEEIGIWNIECSPTPVFAANFWVVDPLRLWAIVFYEVRKWDGTPWPKEAQGFGWFREQELVSLALLPGNLAANAVIKHLLYKRD